MATITITDLASLDWLLGDLEGHIEVLNDEGDSTVLCERLQGKLLTLGLGTHEISLSGDELELLANLIENCIDYPDEFDPSHVQIR